MDLAFNVLKLVGATGAAVTVIIVIARVWSGTARERLITNLEKELELANDHKERADKTVQHYRDEMHSVRNDANAEVAKMRNTLEEAREDCKAIEVENAALKSRPDLSSIEKLLGGHREALDKIGTSLTTHVEADAKIFSSINISLAEVATSLQQMNGNSRRRKVSHARNR